MPDLAAVCARFNEAPYYRHLGLRASSERAGTAHVVLAYDERLTQLYGGIHGGALLSLADAAVNVALVTTFEGAERTATVELTMHFLSPPGRADVEAEGVIVRRGRRLCFAECVLRSEGREIARAKGICKVSGGEPK